MRVEFTYDALKTIKPQCNKPRGVIKYQILLVMLSFKWIFCRYSEANVPRQIPVTAKATEFLHRSKRVYLTGRNVKYTPWKQFDKPHSKRALMFWLIVPPWAASTRQAQGQRANSMQTDQPCGGALLMVQKRSIIFNLFEVPCIDMANYSWAIKGIMRVCVFQYTFE